MTPTVRNALVAAAAAIAVVFATLLATGGPEAESVVCSGDPCMYPLGGPELIVEDGIITLRFVGEATVLFWIADERPIDRFAPPIWSDDDPPYTITTSRICDYVVDALVILPIDTPQDTGGARKLLQEDIPCEPPG